MATCRTCLGQLNLPVNLFNPNYKPLLDVFQLLLTFQVFLPEYEFNICYKCQEKLQGIHEFQKNCLKALEPFQNAEIHLESDDFIKTEPSIYPQYGDCEYPSKLDVRLEIVEKLHESSEKNEENEVRHVDGLETALQVDQDSGDDSPYNPAGEDNDSDSDYHCTESSKGRKRSVRVTRSNPTIRKDIESNSDNSDVEQNSILFDSNNQIAMLKKEAALTEKVNHEPAVKVLKLKQFPYDDVQKALAECNNSIINTIGAESTSCVICNYRGRLRRALTNHMTISHKDKVSNWCRFCNILTDNLPQHEETTKCNEQRCKFCNKNLTNVYSLKDHLRRHCGTEEIVERGVRMKSGRSLTGRMPIQYPVEEVYEAYVACDNAFHYTTDVAKLTCLVCCSKFKLRKGLIRHMTGSHRDQMTNWCRKCNVFTDHLILHEKTTRCCEERCTLCQQTFSQTRSLKQHLSKHCCKNQLDRLIAQEKLRAMEQYPREEVLQAINDCTAYTREPKYRTCLYCNCVVVRARFLTAHMGCFHPEHSKTWCARCNLQTTDLKQHVDSTKCSENRCVFCGDDKFKNISELVEHLRLHCKHIIASELAADDKADNNDNSQRGETIPEQATVSNSLPSGSDSVTPPNISADVKNLEMLLLNSTDNEDVLNNEDDLLTDDIITTTTRRKRIREAIVQFPREVVNQAILDLSNFTNDPKFRQCILCNKHLTELAYLRGHMRTAHKDQFLNWCRNCNFITDDLKEHLKTVKCNIRKCTLCPRKYPNERSVRLHMKKHYEFDGTFGKKPRQRVCPICGKSFRSVGVHIYHSHKKTERVNQKVKCPYCSKIYQSLASLRPHIRRHTEEKTIPCLVCGKTFHLQCQMKLHMEVHEGGPVQCTVCDKVLNRPGVLKLHMRQHTGENKHVCEQCGKSYSKKSLLINHMVCHSEERPHKCKYCEKRFKNTSTLRHHEQAHEGLRPFKCTFCNFKSVQPNALTIHMKMHPEDAPQANNPYKCSFCHRAFSTNALLQSHTNYIHGENGKDKKRKDLVKPLYKS